MRQHYNQIRFLLLALSGLFTPNLLLVQAQSIAPQIQWQRVLEDPTLSTTSTVRAVKTTTGRYGILADKNLSLLTSAGDLIWTKPLPGSYADSSTNRIALSRSVAITTSSDGGFAILAQDVTNRFYVTKLDAQGANVWTKTVGSPAGTSSIRLTGDALIAAPDGSYLVVGSFADQLTYLTLTKLSAEGYIVGQWRVRFTGPTPASRLSIRQILNLPNQGYLLVGQAADSTARISKGVAFQLNAQYAVVWQQQYTTLATIQDVVLNSDRSTYTAIGLINENGQAITIAPNKPGDGNILISLTAKSTATALVSQEDGTVTILDAVNSNNGDFRLSNGRLPAQFSWTTTFGGSRPDLPSALLTTDDGGYLAVGTTESTDGAVQGKPASARATWVVKLGMVIQTDSLQLIAPTYNCQTGAIIFHTTGGDGTPIEYAAEGVTDWTTNPDQTVEQRYRTADDTPLLRLMARQSGRNLLYIFDQKAACGRARIGLDDLSVKLLGNPVHETAQVQVAGAAGQPIQFDLFDTRGGLIEQRLIGQAQTAEQQTFDLRQQSVGTLLLRATINGQVHMLRVLKQ